MLAGNYSDVSLGKQVILSNAPEVTPLDRTTMNCYEKMESKSF